MRFTLWLLAQIIAMPFSMLTVFAGLPVMAYVEYSRDDTIFTTYVNKWLFWPSTWVNRLFKVGENK